MAGSVFRPVLPGARVAIVAPSGPFRPEKVEPARAALTARGIRAGPGPASAAPEDGFLAGPDERRLASVVDALGDPDVAALWAARGGYGATRIARLVPLPDVRAAGKPLVGYSDATALLARWFAAGVGALHGPLATSVGEEPAESTARLLDLLAGVAPPGPLLAGLEPRAGRGREARGRLFAGNLSVLAALAGTPVLPPLAGAILALEDVGEAPYRVDRMFTQLLDSGALDGLAGAVLGTFERCAAGPEGPPRPTAEETAVERLSRLDVPVLAGGSFGHGRPNLALPVGALARLDPSAGTLSFEAWSY